MCQPTDTCRDLRGALDTRGPMHSALARAVQAIRNRDVTVMEAVAEWEIWAREGERQLAARRLPEAEVCFERALALGAGAAAHAGLGLTRLARGARAEAELELIEATRLDPRCEWGWYGRGVAAAQRGAPDDACRCLERALALNPENPDARQALALLRGEPH